MFDNNDGAWAGDDDNGFDEEHFGSDTRNPAVTREQDARTHSPPAKTVPAPQPKTTALAERTALVAVYDKNSQPLVARTVMRNGKPFQLEEFRRPTPDEYNALMFNGRIVRGGVVAENVPTSTNEEAAVSRAPLGAWSPVKKVVVIGGVGLALVGAGYGIYRWRKGRRA